MPQIGYLPRQTAQISAVVAPAAVLRFYRTGTSTPQNAYTDSALSNAVTSLTADSAGLFNAWFLNPNAVADYRYTLETSAGVIYYTQDNIARQPFTQSDVGSILYPQTAAELAVSVTPTNYFYTPTPYGYTNVLRYGADPTGVADSTTAFNNARIAGLRVFVPRGTYKVTDVAIVSDCWFEGEGDGLTALTTLQVGANSTAAFRHSSASIVHDVTIKNFNIKAASGITGAKGYRQDDKSVYLANAIFEGICTGADLLIGYDGFFIITRWVNCYDGFVGTPPGAQQHQMLTSIPSSFSQLNESNLCQLVNCHVYAATSGVSAAVDIAHGSNWSFHSGTHFENMDAPAIRARGIFVGNIDECWFENIRATSVISLSDTSLPRACYAWGVANSMMAVYGMTGGSVISVSGATFISVRECAGVLIPAAITLCNAAINLSEVSNIRALSGAGAAGFLTGLPYIERGTFTVTLTGVVGTVSSTAYYERNGNAVNLFLPTLSGTSNATGCTLTGLPTSLRPARTQGNWLALMTDNGAALVLGVLQVDTAGVITAYKSITAVAGAWTAAGTKGVSASNQSYTLS